MTLYLAEPRHFGNGRPSYILRYMTQYALLVVRRDDRGRGRSVHHVVDDSEAGLACCFCAVMPLVKRTRKRRDNQCA